MIRAICTVFILWGFIGLATDYAIQQRFPTAVAALCLAVANAILLNP